MTLIQNQMQQTLGAAIMSSDAVKAQIEQKFHMQCLLLSHWSVHPLVWDDPEMGSWLCVSFLQL
jgi:hypothetical protein